MGLPRWKTESADRLAVEPLDRLWHCAGLQARRRRTRVHVCRRTLQGPHHRVRNGIRQRSRVSVRRGRRRADRRPLRLAQRNAGTASTASSTRSALRRVKRSPATFLDGMTRENFRIAHDISAYSFPALAKAAQSMLSARCLVAHAELPRRRARDSELQHDGSRQSLARGERALSGGVARNKGVRVNGISAGPIKTLAASGIKGFGKILDFVESNAPLRRNVTIDQVGNVAAFLLSDLAAGVTRGDSSTSIAASTRWSAAWPSSRSNGP